MPGFLCLQLDDLKRGIVPGTYVSRKTESSLSIHGPRMLTYDQTLSFRGLQIVLIVIPLKKRVGWKLLILYRSIVIL